MNNATKARFVRLSQVSLVWVQKMWEAEWNKSTQTCTGLSPDAGLSKKCHVSEHKPE